MERKGASGAYEKKEGIGDEGTQTGVGGEEGEERKKKKKIADRKELPRGEARLHGYFVFCEWGRTLATVIVQQHREREKWHKRETAQKRTRLTVLPRLATVTLGPSRPSSIEFFYLLFPHLREWKVNSLPVKKTVFRVPGA